MNLQEKRQIAIGAARAEIRKLGAEFSLKNAEIVLDELGRTEPDLIASDWWLNSSNHQYKLFCREWQKWQKKNVF